MKSDVGYIYGYIYRIYDTINSMSYIGQTTKEDPLERINQHFKRSHNRYLRHSINKRRENFDYEILYGPIHEDELDYMEQYMILEFNSLFPNGFNFNSGGNKNKRHSKDTIEKIRKDEIWNNKDDIIKRYKNGQSASSIALDYECDRKTIVSVLKEYKVPKHNHGRSLIKKHIRDDIEIISKRYQNGETSKDISKDYQVAPNTIIRVLRENNIPIRKRFNISTGLQKDIHIICKRYLNGESAKMIGSDYNASSSVILDNLRKNNIPIRKPGGDTRK